MPGDNAVELGQSLDLIDDDAAHLRRAFGRLLRQLENAATQFGARRSRAPAAFPSPSASCPARSRRSARRTGEHAVHLAGRLPRKPCSASRRCACAPPRRSCARARIAARWCGTLFAARLGDDAGDLAGPRRRGIEQLVEQAGEAPQPLLEIVGAGIERGDERLELVCRCVNPSSVRAIAAFPAARPPPRANGRAC